jgi:hypothetical protein
VFAVWSLIDNGDGALALYTSTWVGELAANIFIWKSPRVAAAGGVAMGAIVVPALLVRARRPAATGSVSSVRARRSGARRGRCCPGRRRGRRGCRRPATPRPTRVPCCACVHGTRSARPRAHARGPRLRMVIERFATYAGADPRRAAAALAVAGYVGAAA